MATTADELRQHFLAAWGGAIVIRLPVARRRQREQYELLRRRVPDASAGR
ncbi:hypothetical protein [Cellulomonas sp.]|nr:hypothetical protein [Cellulomonas sp.]MBO9554264.1 hypothetical protein [Cellulomonas sp.]